MALTEQELQDKIEIVSEHKMIQVRTATIIKRDGIEISRSFHRHVVVPCTKDSGSWADTDISGESTEVQAIANAVWTDAIKTNYQQMIDVQEI